MTVARKLYVLALDNKFVIKGRSKVTTICALLSRPLCTYSSGCDMQQAESQVYDLYCEAVWNENVKSGTCIRPKSDHRWGLPAQTTTIFSCFLFQSDCIRYNDRGLNDN